VLIVAKGVAQGCAAHITRYFADRKTPVTLAVGQGSSDAVFARRWLSDGDARIVMLDKTDDHNSGDIRTLIRSTASDLIISAGPDIQHRMLQTLANEIAPRSRTAYTNNALMCCGEGICGSCTVSGAAAPARACKVMPPVNILRF